MKKKTEKIVNKFYPNEAVVAKGHKHATVNATNVFDSHSRESNI